MIHTLLYSLVFLITLLILVTIHEWGHFWVARRLGVKTLRFSFGFGKRLWRRIGRDGTEYVFSLLPLGGYVQLLDGREAPTWPADKRALFQLAPFSAAKEAVAEVWRIIKFNGVILKKIMQGKISLLSIGGPITIFQTSALAFQQGIAVYISFLGLMSVMLACINLLPIPGLDGGQLLFCLLECILRRPIALRWQLFFLRLGIVCLVLLMAQATVNDIIRFFS